MDYEVYIISKRVSRKIVSSLIIIFSKLKKMENFKFYYANIPLGSFCLVLCCLRAYLTCSHVTVSASSNIAL